jgi:protein phosphatase
VPKPPSVIGLSDIGRARSRNEDSFCVAPEQGVAVVADGMGGHPGGDVASRIAAEMATNVLREAAGTGSANDPVTHMRTAMARSVVAAHEAIRAQGRSDPELAGMGTTLTAMIVDAPTGRYVLGHVGDSRAYLFRDGRLTQLTRDDTWVQERVEASQLTPAQARRHPFGHLLTQCLGLDDPPIPHILGGDAEPGDAYLLCTDGLVGMLEDEEMERILLEHLGTNGVPQEAEAPVRALLEAANEAGGLDNITAALVRLSQE